jgi:hypothetical protein
MHSTTWLSIYLTINSGVNKVHTDSGTIKTNKSNGDKDSGTRTDREIGEIITKLQTS